MIMTIIMIVWYVFGSFAVGVSYSFEDSDKSDARKAIEGIVIYLFWPLHLGMFVGKVMKGWAV
jgi:hypothetical protein